MSTVRLQQLLALKEELGPPELQPHERFSALQAQRQAASPGGSSGGGGGGSSTPSSPSLQQQHELHRWFPFGAELLQSPVKWRLDPRSQDPRMQELTAALHQFVRPVAAGGPPGAFETLCSVRNTLFDIIIAKVWGARVFESRGVAGLDVLNDLALDQLLKCFCKVVHTYKKQQLLLNYGGDENVFRLQKGDQAVRQWCLVVFEGTDTATIKQGGFGWEDRLTELLQKLFSWRRDPDDADPKAVHQGRSVFHFGAHPVPQDRVFRALQLSRVFRRLFQKLHTADYPHPLLVVAQDNLRPQGTPSGLELEVFSLVRVNSWDDRHGCAHVQQLGWNPTEKDLIIPLDKCPDGKKDNVVPGAILEVGKMRFKDGEVPTCNGLTDRWIPASRTKLIHKAPPRGQKQKQSHEQHGKGGNKGKQIHHGKGAGGGGGGNWKHDNKQHGNNHKGGKNKGKGGNQHKGNKNVCHAWQKHGACNRKDCKFEHPK